MPIGKKPCPDCGGPLYRGSPRCKACHIKRQPAPPVPVVAQIAADREKQRTAGELTSLRRKYDEATRIIDRQERELRSMNVLNQGLDTFTIEARKGTRTSEGTVVIVASDWHIEENVGAEVGGLNLYNVEIAKARAKQFFQGSARLVALLQQDITIETIVLALLGDFITNDIHDDFLDINEQQPMHALVTAQNFLISGIEFLLANTSVANIIIPCHSGNHARTTKTTRFASENGHSLEYLLYLHLASHFRLEPRIQFIIPEGMHSYLKVYDMTLRFQHGHAMKYHGGVGGIYIPVNKTIAQLNKARHADIDIFGHFHQLRDGGNFICNGSLIGYNAYALANHFDFEKPKQALFLVDSKRGKTCTWPVLV